MAITMGRATAATPIRFHVLAFLGTAATYVVGSRTEWDPWLHDNTTLADGWGDLAASLSLILWVAVPLGALLWPLRAAILAFVPFGFFTLLLSGRHEWPFALFLALTAAAMVALWSNRRSALIIASAALVPILSYLLGLTTILLPYQTRIETWPHQEPSSLVLTFGMYALAVSLCLGVAWWMRRSALASRYAAELEARSGEVERESAAVGERARLARDLHDVVAHHVSLIAVRAETAPYTVSDLTPEARTLLAEIAADSRRALDELRGVLGILRRSAESRELAPQPMAEDIAGLVEQARSAGAEIEWEATQLNAVTPTAGYVAYRVVQEALTNARRHAAGARVHLVTEGADGGVNVRATNNTSENPIVEGRGLTGMRERVEALGGTLTVRVREGMLEVVAKVPGTAP
jgi:signal transduction histidine kinase